MHHDNGQSTLQDCKVRDKLLCTERLNATGGSANIYTVKCMSNMLQA